MKGEQETCVRAKRAPLPVYRPTVTHADIYFAHPGKRPLLEYNHDVDIAKFKGRFFAAWNANETGREDVPGQFNFLSASDDFRSWSDPVRLFMAEAGCENPVESDNQWQPIFLNCHDRTLFCAWCDYNARRTFVSASTDGMRWTNRDVAVAPPALRGRVVGFPTNHGLLTSRDVMMFPCSLPAVEPKCIVGHTRHAGVLLSDDGGRTWTWSEPIEALTWSAIGEAPAAFGGETVYLWEPMLFEQADGRIGLLIRNSTAQDAPERAEKPHRMLLYATSEDHGHTWSKARPVEVDTICSRNFAAAGSGTADSLLMVHNDMHVGVPQRISHDRYFLALFCSPVCEPDLLLPGPIVQPAGGTAFYPNGFIDDGRLYLAYTYPRGIHSSIVEPLPDFSRAFLLPRGGRPGLRIEDGIATFEQRQTSLGLVLTAGLTRRKRLRLAFDVNVHRYPGTPWPLLTLGGKTRQGALLRAVYSEGKSQDVFQVRADANECVDVGRFRMRAWLHIEVEMTESGFSVAADGGTPAAFGIPLLRKICFGGLYERPEWPMGMARAQDVRLNLDTLLIE